MFIYKYVLNFFLKILILVNLFIDFFEYLIIFVYNEVMEIV